MKMNYRDELSEIAIRNKYRHFLWKQENFLG